ncbi:hypothetical protein LOD99_11050 [Oopsacas minuta]|uniref:Protein-tyrosine sulfotransferase n=1 Tax=Oopsacas minuta TaxID=111878 RepID=A0AAV7KB35_9METZ|nr:hypothetical protein LOD99_11050 [Oopsacas minuta]
MRTEYLYILIVFVLQILSVIGQEPQITISTTSTLYTNLPPDSNTPEIIVLTQDVTLQANKAGIWQRPDKTYNSDNTINFDVFTIAYVGLYKFYAYGGDGDLTIQIDISATGSKSDGLNGTNFAEMTSSGVYNFLTGYEVFYTDTTLICATSDSTEPQWSKIGIPSGNNAPSGIWNSDTGISTLSIQTTAQGYYTCSEGALFTASIFDQSITTVVKQGEEYTYSYTKGVDSSDIQLFCANSINRAFPDMKWGSFGNPVIPNNVPNQESGTFDCTFGPIDILSIDLLVQGTPAITLSTTPDTIYSMLPTATDNNTANIPVLSVNVTLQTNLIGRWLEPDGSYIDGNIIEIIVFTVDLVGIYQFSVINWENQEEKAIQINISAIGTSIGMEANSSITTISSNTIFYQDTITLIAATNKITLQQNDVVWSYQRSFNDTKSNIPETKGAQVTLLDKSDNNSKSFFQLIERFQNFVGYPLKFFHIIRNPYDNIATLYLYSISRQIRKEAFAKNLTVETNPKGLMGLARAHISDVKKLQRHIEYFGNRLLTLHNEDMVSNPKLFMKRMCNHMEIYCNDYYLEKTSEKVFSSVTKSRHSLDWRQDVKKLIDTAIQTYPFLNRYSFEN